MTPPSVSLGGCYFVGGDILAISAQKIKQMCQKIAQEAIRNSLNDIVFDIENMYQSVIEQFYNDYSPSEYSRTYSGYEAYTKHIKKIPNGYECGIIVDGSKIPQGTYFSIYDNTHIADSDWVFNRGFIEGFHGFKIESKYFPTPMSPAPKEQMERLFKEYENSGKPQAVFRSNIKKAIQKFK